MVPSEFKKVINILEDEKPKHFLYAQGCGLVAALFAEVAQAQGESGSFYLIYPVLEGGRYTPHICFKHFAGFHTYIYDAENGHNAAKQYELDHTNECDEEDLGKPSFEYEEIAVTETSDIRKILKDIHHQHSLGIRPEWLDQNYCNLRGRILSHLKLKALPIS